MTYEELRLHGKSVGTGYMEEVFKYDDLHYIVNFDNPDFTPIVSRFHMPSYQTLCEYGEKVDYFPLDGSEHIRLYGLTFKVQQTDVANLEIALV